jgi:hypothetical protein
MTHVDFGRQIQYVADRADTETHPPYRAMLEVWLEHLKAEAALDIDRTMATVSPDAHFHSWGGVFSDPDGARFDQVRGRYKAVMDSGGFPPLELLCERFFIGPDAILLEGDNRSVLTSEEAREAGFEVTDGRRYVGYSRLCCWVPFKDGKILAEDLYWHPPYRIEPLDEGGAEA